MTYPKHEKALHSALADVGVHEQPMGSNRGPRVQVYQHATWLGGTGWPWCCAFLLYHQLAGGLNMPYKGAGAYALHAWAKQHGWLVTAKNAMPGDSVVFNLGAGHAAMLRAPVVGAKVKTVDGNVSDRVDLRERPLSLVRGFIHIPEVAFNPPPARAPIFEVIGSVSGHQKIVFSGRRGAVANWLARTPIGARYGGVTIRKKRR